MSVFKRATSKGFTKEYHYRFNYARKRFSGVCEKCFSEKKAKEFEAEVRKDIKNLKQIKSKQALVIEYRNELSGGKKIPLKDAFDLSMKKPRKRPLAKRQSDTKRNRWLDFAKYMESNYPEIESLADVKKTHAEEYIQFYRTQGRWDKEIKSKQGNYKADLKKLSPKTCNDLLMNLKEVFTLLEEDAGLLANPFSKIHKLKADPTKREVFSNEELEKIRDNADDFLLPLFKIGGMTALRLGDVCTLKKNEIDLDNRLIRRVANKTGKLVEIPIMKELYPLLEELLEDEKNDTEYLLKDQAYKYIEHRTIVSKIIKDFLDSLDIENQDKSKDRDRAVSIKGFHSLRHTFCYLAGIAGIPMAIVQSIVGHMTPEMTEHYMAHTTIQDKQKAILELSKSFGLLNGNDKPNPDELERLELIEIIKTLPNSEIKRIRKSISPKLLPK